MTSWASLATDHLWRTAIATVPLTVLVLLICRCLPCRAATRHSLWVIVLSWFVISPILPDAGVPAPLSPDPSYLANHDEDDGLRDSEESWPPDSAVIGPRDTEADGPVVQVDEANPAVVQVDEANRSDLLLAPTRFGPSASDHSVGLQTDDRLSRRLRPRAEWRGSSPQTSSAAEYQPKRPSRSTDIDGIDEVAAGLPEDSLARFHPAGQSHAEGGRLGDDTETESTEAGYVEADRGWQDDSGVGFEAPVLVGGPGVRQPLTSQSSSVESESPVRHGDHSDGLADEKRDREFKRWVAGLLAVRDSVGQLPVMPVHVWIGGAALFLLLGAGRVYSHHRWLGRGVPAGGDVQRQVDGIARELGLRRAPTTVFVTHRASPMIWCGWRLRLVIPTGLWSQLDGPGRRAVIIHELAHISRRDHWVCWLETLVSGVYWWHPVVWWVRHRIHEEADHCCDAWVTWMMPKGRRVYAEALLTTKEYLGDQGGRPSALGMGVLSKPARKLARRIALVMTESVTPGRSVWGGGLGLLVIVVGWTLTPASLSAAPGGNEAPAEATGDMPADESVQSNDDREDWELDESRGVDGGIESPPVLDSPGTALELQVFRMEQTIDAMATQIQFLSAGLNGPSFMDANEIATDAVGVPHVNRGDQAAVDEYWSGEWNGEHAPIDVDELALECETQANRLAGFAKELVSEAKLLRDAASVMLEMGESRSAAADKNCSEHKDCVLDHAAEMTERSRMTLEKAQELENQAAGLERESQVLWLQAFQLRAPNTVATLPTD